MPPNQRRRFHTNSKKNKKVPETASDFLSAGIEYEEAGDRWRPSDKPKAGRFYQRAIEAYQSSLRLSPWSFDAAYNKARLEFKVSQERELVPRKEKRGVLERALQSHLDCLALDPRNDDALFNTAQVYSSLAEIILSDDADRELAAGLLGKATDLFSDCLERQQATFESYSAPPLPPLPQEGEMDTESGGISLLQAPPSPEETTMVDADEVVEYAVVQEPVTPSTILDTLLELLHTLSILLPLRHSPQPLIQAAENLLASKLPPLSTALPGRQIEYCIAAAATKCAIAETRFRTATGASSPGTWEAAISASFNTVEWAFVASAEALCAKADAHMALAEAVPELAWKHYAFASQALAEAAKLDPTKGDIFSARGDVELLRSHIECAARTEQVRDLLRKNAGVFYRCGMKLEETVKGENEVKEAVLRFESGDVAALKVLGNQEARGIVKDAVEEGVFEAQILGEIYAFDCS